MNPTDQIAAEAVKKIRSWKYLNLATTDAAEETAMLSIIQSAIKKTHQEGWYEGRQRGQEDAQSDDTKRLDYISTGLYEIRKAKRGWAILKGFTNYEYDLHPTLREAIDAAMRKD